MNKLLFLLLFIANTATTSDADLIMGSRVIGDRDIPPQEAHLFILTYPDGYRYSPSPKGDIFTYLLAIKEEDPDSPFSTKGPIGRSAALTQDDNFIFTLCVVQTLVRYGPPKKRKSNRED